MIVMPVVGNEAPVDPTPEPVPPLLDELIVMETVTVFPVPSAGKAESVAAPARADVGIWKLKVADPAALDVAVAMTVPGLCAKSRL